MHLIIYEDKYVKQLKPFSINHASFEIRIGRYSLLERIISNISKNNNIEDVILIVRQELEEIIKERFPEFKINPEIVPKGKCINGSTYLNEEQLKSIKENNAISNEKLLLFNLETDIPLSRFYENVDNEGLVSNHIDILKVDYLWDSFNFIDDAIINDANYFQKQNDFKLHPSSIVENIENIFFGKKSIIKAGVILDASKGPIIIDHNAIIGYGAIIEGPVYIGENSVISMGAKIKGCTSIGRMCKIGGEISNSIFQGFSNKAHDGFIGHSFIGEWVNIGAGTNNSNLKNNYNSIKIDIGYDKIQTNLQFLGLLIGDYSKLGISSIINTGTYIGMASNILGGKIISNHIPSFYWDKNTRVDLNKLFISISKMKNRRNKDITNIEKSFLKNKY